MGVIRKKKRLWKVYKTTKDYAEYQAYLKVQRSVAKVIRAAKKKFERQIARDKNNHRQFYSHLNKCMKSRVQVGPLRTADGEMVADSAGMCDVLNKQFTSVFTNEDCSHIPPPIQLHHGDPLSIITVEAADVAKKITNLKENSAPGPLKFTPRILKELRDVISLPLSIIFNKSILSGEVPSDWRCANVASVFKKGSRAIAENYRPISLTSIICKILESIIHRSIVAHLKQYDLINSSQHGFRQHRSCLTNLLEYLETLTSLIDAGHNVDVFYLDLSKAFDRVPHQRLLAKLKCHGIDGKIFNWVKSWLSDRKQRTVLNGHCSSWSAVSSGVPQGSVLGPLLFIIFINDIDNAVDIVHCALFKFADDTKGVHIVNSKEDATRLQLALDNLHKWSVEWQMLFNLDKCHILHFGSTNLCHAYNINGHMLASVEEEKDLGIYISNCCTPSKHVTAAAQKANQVLGQLLCVITYRDKHTFIKLFKMYVRSQLEYCGPAWSPWLQKDKDLLEKVQQRAVNAVSGLTGSYNDKLLQLKLPSLIDRRSRGDMIQTYKIVNKVDNVDPNKFFTFSAMQHGHATRQAASITGTKALPSLGLSRTQCKLELRNNFFSQRVVEPWNALPAEAHRAASVDDFKMKYDYFHAGLANT